VHDAIKADSSHCFVILTLTNILVEKSFKKNAFFVIQI